MTEPFSIRRNPENFTQLQVFVDGNWNLIPDAAVTSSMSEYDALKHNMVLRHHVVCFELQAHKAPPPALIANPADNVAADPSVVVVDSTTEELEN